MIIIIFFISCNGNSKQVDTKSQTTEKKTSEEIENEYSLIIENRITHTFSDPEKKDEFHVFIKGKSLLEGKVIFTIHSFEGIEIYKEEFPSVFLMGYDVDNNADVTTKENFIKKRVLEFFSESNFYKPAIKQNETFDEDYSEKTIWEEIKEDQTAIGFRFLIGEEDNRSIAFSKKSKSVVLYFNCC